MTPELLLGNSYAGFIGFTVLVMCSAAALIGRQLAQTWRPARRLIPYGIVLTIVDRLLGHVLTGSQLASPGGWLIDSYCILMASGLGYRYVLAQRLAQQYPWMYRPFLWFGWRRVDRISQTQDHVAELRS